MVSPEGADLNWEQLLALNLVRKIQIVIGPLACTICKEDARIHRSDPAFREMDGLHQFTRRMCDEKLVIPIAYSTSIVSRGNYRPAPSVVVQDSLF
jgi:hypothetical protein